MIKEYQTYQEAAQDYLAQFSMLMDVPAEVSPTATRGAGDVPGDSGRSQSLQALGRSPAGRGGRGALWQLPARYCGQPKSEAASDDSDAASLLSAEGFHRNALAERSVSWPGDIESLRTFGALPKLKLYFLALFQGAEACALNGREMDKDVLALLAGDEPVTL